MSSLDVVQSNGGGGTVDAKGVEREEPRTSARGAAKDVLKVHPKPAIVVAPRMRPFAAGVLHVRPTAGDEEGVKDQEVPRERDEGESAEARCTERDHLSD